MGPPPGHSLQRSHHCLREEGAQERWLVRGPLGRDGSCDWGEEESDADLQDYTKPFHARRPQGCQESVPADRPPLRQHLLADKPLQQYLDRCWHRERERDLWGHQESDRPSSSKSTPLKSKTGEVITDQAKQLERWVEHYLELYATQNVITDAALAAIPDIPVMEELDTPPTEEDLSKAINSLASGKSPGSDSIPAEVLKSGEPALLEPLRKLLCRCREEGYIPQDMRDAAIVTLYKNPRLPRLPRVPAWLPCRPVNGGQGILPAPTSREVPRAADASLRRLYRSNEGLWLGQQERTRRSAAPHTCLLWWHHSTTTYTAQYASTAPPPRPFLSAAE